MLAWSDLGAPFLAFAASLPAVTLAFLLWMRTRDRSFELLATGLGLLAVLGLVLSLGVFLWAARLVSNPDLRFVLWNATFLLSFVSLVVLRRFAATVIPGPETQRHFPRLFSAVSAAVYGAILVLAFVVTPPWLNFQSRGVYALSAVYYLTGFLGPALRLARARALPGWVSVILKRGPWVIAPAALLALYEGVKLFAGTGWPSLGSLAPIPLFVLVTVQLFSMLRTEPSSGPAEAVQRIAARCLADPLTKREVEVLALLLEGWRNQDIAERLGLSPNTVKNHVYNVYQKTGAANRLELAALAEEKG